MEDRQKTKNRDLLEWYDALVFAVAALVLLFCFGARTVVVDGSSMLNTLVHGDRLLVQTGFYTPERGDVVVVDGYNGYGKPLVKRVIGVGGDTIDIDPDLGIVYRNGEPLAEPYTRDGVTLGTGDTVFPITVPEGTLFLMGDNRQNSTDSRSSRVGCVDERDILGKVLLRIFPLNKFGRI